LLTWVVLANSGIDIATYYVGTHFYYVLFMGVVFSMLVLLSLTDYKKFISKFGPYFMALPWNWDDELMKAGASAFVRVYDNGQVYVQQRIPENFAPKNICIELPPIKPDEECTRLFLGESPKIWWQVSYGQGAPGFSIYSSSAQEENPVFYTEYLNFPTDWVTRDNSRIGHVDLVECYPIYSHTSHLPDGEIIEMIPNVDLAVLFVSGM
jgi:hypothetical protein